MFGRSRYRTLTALVVIGCIAMLPLNLFAAAVGQIKGVITDKESGDPIIGASIQIMGTFQGAKTDPDGKYIIARVEPGIYTLRVTMLGYDAVEITDVIVKSDLSTEQNQAISKKITDIGKTIRVVADRDIIDKFETSSQQVISRETIARQPVTTVDQLLIQVAGVQVSNEGEIFIRGGRAGEVAFIVDGVPIGDPLGGLGQAGASLSLASGSIQEFTVIKDGFDPEYGNALSGIIKVNTQTGSKDVTRFNVQFITDDFGNASLNKYSRNNDFVRASLSGPGPILSDKILPSLGLNFLRDKEFTYYFYTEVDKSNGYYQYESFDTPITRRPTSSFNLLGFDIPERLQNNYFYQANFKIRPTPNLKILVSLKNRETRRTLFVWDHRFTPETAPVRVDKWRSFSMEVSQTLHRNMYYEAIVSYSDVSVSQMPGDPLNPGHGKEPDSFPFDFETETYEDRNNNGVYDAPEPIFNLFPDTASYGTDFYGPAYTVGEYQIDGNIQAASEDQIYFRFNDNGMFDDYEGEPYIDLNGNGVWDEGDFLTDRNGNGLLDENREDHVYQRFEEPYIDGDSVIGERFTDVNGNGVYDQGMDIFVMAPPFDPSNMDLNNNGMYDGPLSQWDPKIPFVDRNGNGLYDRPNARYDAGEPFTDVNGNGVWDGGSTFLNPGSFDEDALWHYRRSETYRGEIKVFWRLGSHELKAGAAVDKRYFFYQEIEKPYLAYTGRNDGGPFGENSEGPGIPGRGSFRDMWEYDPWGGTVYLRDKLEYGSMIASLGLRLDFYIQDKNDLVEIARNDDLGSGVIKGDRHKLSPRIGFSYPISDKAKVYFNYGHFYQLPSFQRMFRRNTTSVDQNVIVGNYNLDYAKTIQYSFGVKYGISDSYSVDFSGYFKDEFDKVNPQLIRRGGLSQQQYRNKDYGRSRGVEFQLERRGTGYINGILSYSYAFAFGKASQTSDNYLSEFEWSREPLSEAPLDNDIRHRLVSSIQVYIPTTVKPRLFGVPIPNGWSMSLVTQIESGEPFTPTREYPGVDTREGEDIQRNSLRMPATINFDIRATKSFKLAGLDYDVILWVENLFDNRNVEFVYKNTGLPNTKQNQSGVIFGGTEYDLDPTNWNFGRQVRVGLEVTL